MACSKNQDCLRIATDIYPGLQGEIDGSIQTIVSSLNDITGELSTLTVPGDYLGNKVREKLETIISSLDSDKSNVEAAKGNIDTFIGEKVEEHLEHYDSWEREQEELKKKQKYGEITLN